MASHRNSVESLAEPLTERELEILACLADGLSNQEIANKLFLAEQTVRWYNSQIYSKLGVNSRQAAVERAQALGLLSKIAAVVGKHNLPAQATPFVGRQHELDEITTLLKDDNTRLITILAPGGMGKTRLAMEAARHQIGRFADGVIFVPLAPLSSPSDIVTAIAENIGFSFYGDNPPSQQLTDFLRERSMLLLLDNFEHLLDGSQLVADLTQIAPNIRLMTTSRERLNLRGETVYTLRGLEFPTWETPEDALQYDAVKLFMQSAHRVRSDFALQTPDLHYLARICRLTAGMPLGIELAAGWVDVFTLEQIASEIQKGIDILETEMRDVPERQRSVRATFDRTWERLTADEQTVFMRLSVFRGGFTVQAAQAVAGAGGRSLRQLANKALVQVSPDGRHDIHELLRQFGAEKLIASGEQTTIQAKHAAYFADFMAERKQHIRTNRQLEILQSIDPDFENVRSAWLYMVNQQEWDQLPKFLDTLWFYLDVRSRGREGVELFEQAMKMLQSTPTIENELTLGRVLARLAWFYSDNGFWEKSAVVCDKSIRILRQYDSPEDFIAALHSRQNVAEFLNKKDTMLSNSKEGLAFARSMNDKGWLGDFLVWTAFPGTINGDFVSALDYIEKGIAILDELGDRWTLIRAYHILVYLQMKQNKYEGARRWMQQALTFAESFRHVFGTALSNLMMGRIDLHERSYTTAHMYLSKALQGYWNGGYYWLAPLPMTYFVQMYADLNETDRAVEIMAAIHKYPISFMETDDDVQALHHQLETKLEPERFAAAWARGEKRELSTVVTELLAELADE